MTTSPRAAPAGEPHNTTMAYSVEDDTFLLTQRLSIRRVLRYVSLIVGGYVLFLLFFVVVGLPEVAGVLAIPAVILGLFAADDQMEKAKRFLAMDEGKGDLFQGENHALKWWFWGMIVLVRESHTLVLRKSVKSSTGPTDFLRWKGQHIEAWKRIQGFYEYRESFGFIIPLWHAVVEVGTLRIIDPDFEPVMFRTIDGQTVKLDLRSPVAIVNPVVFAARVSGMSLEEKLKTLDGIVRKRIQDAVAALGSQLSIDTLVGIPFPELMSAFRGRRVPSLSYGVAYEQYVAQMDSLEVPEDKRQFTADGPKPNTALALPAGMPINDYGWSHSTRLRRIVRVELGYARKSDNFNEEDYSPDDLAETPEHILPGGYLLGLNDEILLLTGAVIPLTRFKLQQLILPDNIIRAAEEQTTADMSRQAANFAGKALGQFAREAGIPPWVAALIQGYTIAQGGRGLFEASQSGGGKSQQRPASSGSPSSGSSRGRPPSGGSAKPPTEPES